MFTVKSINYMSMHSTYGNTEMKPSNSVDEFKLNELHSTNHTTIVQNIISFRKHLMISILFHSLTSLYCEASVDLLGQCWRIIGSLC